MRESGGEPRGEARIRLEPAQIVGQSPAISSAAAIGICTCASSEGARPSHEKLLPQARFHSEGVLRLRGVPA